MTYEELSALMRTRPSGPRPFYSAVHLVRFLELVETRHYGRKELVERLRVGEGSVRTMTNLLRHSGLIQVVRAGSRLTEEGARLLSSLRTQFSRGVEVPRGRALVDSQNVAILVRGGGARASLGVAQRDAALFAGSSGASTFVEESGTLAFPGVNPDLAALDPQLSEALREKLQPREGDAVVVGSAGDPDMAYLGAIAAAVSLLSPPLV